MILASTLILSASPLHANEAVSRYRAVFKPAYDRGGKLWIAIRAFELGAKPKYLAVEPDTFETSVIDAQSIKDAPKGGWKNSAYGTALRRYTGPDAKIQNSGLTKAADGKGLFLTVDMCPSQKPFDMGLFKATIGLPGVQDKPVPVAIAVSGLWMDRHKDDLEWVLGEVGAGRLAVTWVNHSFSHPYDKDKPLEENFLLKPGVDFEKEVLYEEQALLEKDLLPSPFFRFPGLVSNNGLLKKLRALSLIPIGANAWLAKGEDPKDGSIILVHGNGNEPEGIKGLLEFYRDKKEEFGNGELRFLPLKDALRGK